MKELLRIVGLLLLVAIGLAAVVIGLGFLLNACGFFDCTTSCSSSCSCSKSTGPAIEEGTYDFNMDTMKKFVTYNVRLSQGDDQNWFERCYHFKLKNDYTQAVTVGELEFTFEPAQKTVKGEGAFGCTTKEKVDYLVFEDCVISIEVTINGKTEVFDIELNGMISALKYTCRVSIEPAHEVVASYKILSCSGTVFAPPNTTETVTYGDYILQYDEKTDSYFLVGFKNSPKVLYIYDSVDVGTGKKPLNISKMDFLFGKQLDKTEIIVFEGSFDITDFGRAYKDRDGVVYKREVELYDSNFEKYYGKLKTIVIKEVTGRLSDVSTISFTLPERGITFYVNDHSDGQAFIRSLEQAYFVNGIYSYESYSE